MVYRDIFLNVILLMIGRFYIEIVCAKICISKLGVQIIISHGYMIVFLPVCISDKIIS